MKTQLLIVAIMSIGILSGCDDDEERICLRGSGNVQTYEIQAEPYTSIHIYGPVNLRYTQQEATSITVEAEPEMYRYLTYRVTNNELNIGYENNISCFETAFGVWINVSNPELRTIKAEGANEILTIGDINQQSIKVVTDGDAHVTLSGAVVEQYLSGTGQLKVNNFNLLSEKTFIDFEGAANIEVSCSDALDVDATGAATIYYKGNPTITEKGEGAITINDAN